MLTRFGQRSSSQRQTQNLLAFSFRGSVLACHALTALQHLRCDLRFDACSFSSFSHLRLLLACFGKRSPDRLPPVSFMDLLLAFRLCPDWARLPGRGLLFPHRGSRKFCFAFDFSFRFYLESCSLHFLASTALPEVLLDVNISLALPTSIVPITYYATASTLRASS